MLAMQWALRHQCIFRHQDKEDLCAPQIFCLYQHFLPNFVVFLNYFSCSCKISKKEQLKWGRTSFGLQFRKSQSSVAGKMRPFVAAEQKHADGTPDYVDTLFSFFIQPGSLAYRPVLPSLWLGLPQLKHSRNTLTDKPRNVSPQTVPNPVELTVKIN